MMLIDLFEYACEHRLLLFAPALFFFALLIIRGLASVTQIRPSKDRRKSEQHIQRTLTVSDNEVDDGKRINGHRPATRDDWDRWWVKKGFSDGILRHLDEMERDLTAVSLAEPLHKSAEWFSYYEKYRTLCLSCGIWNGVLGDRRAFVADTTQMSMEQQILSDKRLRFANAADYRAKLREQDALNEPYRAALLEYISEQSSHEALRHKMLRDVSERMDIDPDSLRTIYRAMVKGGVLKEAKQDRHYIVKKARKRVSREKRITLPPSVFKSENYANIDRKTKYKVEYTVGTPRNVDRTTNIGEFVSLSCGDTYCTSLEKCTCPVYDGPLNPCKHMVALAMYLGYYRPE